MNENQFSLKQLLAATAVVAVACAILAKMAEIEFLRGPMTFIADPHPSSRLFVLVATPLLAVGMLSVFIKPHVATALACGASALLRLALGVVGAGIGC